jgi:hypothetical protein
VSAVSSLSSLIVDLLLMIERILLIQQGSSRRCSVSVRVLLIDDIKAVVRELRSLLSLNPGWLCVWEEDKRS